MKALGLIIMLTLGVLVAPLVTAAPPQGHIPRLGVLDPNPTPRSVTESPSPRDSARLGLRQGLRELGYVEGQTIVIETRYAEGYAERLPELAAELVRLPVDVLFAIGPAVRAATQATR